MSAGSLALEAKGLCPTFGRCGHGGSASGREPLRPGEPALPTRTASQIGAPVCWVAAKSETVQHGAPQAARKLIPGAGRRRHGARQGNCANEATIDAPVINEMQLQTGRRSTRRRSRSSPMLNCLIGRCF
jgi:hypothetical protein